MRNDTLNENTVAVVLFDAFLYFQSFKITLEGALRTEINV